MFRKSFAFILMFVLACAAAFAQTPEAKKDKEKAAQSMVWTFDGDGGYLGIETVEVTKDNFSKFGLREVRGVAVEKVIDGSPAQSVGLQSGDVITRFNGEEVTSVRKLTRLLGEVAPDHQARLTVSRGGNERELTVTVGKRRAPRWAEGNFSMTFPEKFGKIEIPDMPDLSNLPRVEMPPLTQVEPGTFMWSTGSNRHIGISVTSLTKQLGEYFGVAAGKGLLVTNVRENSPAAKAGLKAGDVIVEFDGKAVGADFDIVRALNEKKEGSISVTVVRERNRQTISVTPEKFEGELNGLFDFPEATDTPGQFKLTQPVAPATPMPLNQWLFPGRVL